jgi:RNA recognition motif-containing protein
MTTVYVGNLPVDAKATTLKHIFSRYGRVTSIQVVRTGLSRSSRSYGLVEMPRGEEAFDAIQKLNGQYFRGLFLRVKSVRGESGAEFPTTSDYKVHATN